VIASQVTLIGRAPAYVIPGVTAKSFFLTATGAAAKSESTAAILAKYPSLLDKLHPLRRPLADGLDISYTQWEAWLALYQDKRLVIAKAADTAPRGPKYASTDTSRAAQQEHLTRLAAVEFTNPDNLAKLILSGAILIEAPLWGFTMRRRFQPCRLSPSLCGGTPPNSAPGPRPF
jgi:hypothetical protein